MREMIGNILVFIFVIIFIIAIIIDSLINYIIYRDKKNIIRNNGGNKND